MKALVFSTVTLLFLLTASCSDDTLKITEEKTETPGNGNLGRPVVSAKIYHVDAPVGWAKKDTAMNGVQFCYLTAPALDSNFNTNMNVLTESMQNLSFDEYKKSTQATMKSYMQGFSIIEGGEIQSVEIKGNWFRYVMEQSGIKMDVINYTFPKNGIAYIVTGAAKAGSMDKYRPMFDAVARSFKLKN